MDEIQTLLSRWVEGDRRAGNEAVRRLEPQWRRAIAAITRAADDRVDELLQELLVQLLTHRPGSPPRALAPAHVTSPAAWRQRVLKNALVSHIRSSSARERAQDAATHDLSAAGARELRERRALGGLVALVQPEQEAADDGEDLAGLRQMREVVQRVLPRLVITRRVALACDLGFDASPWAPDLAVALREELGAVAERLAGAAAGELSAFEVLYPRQSAHDADAFRKLKKRAVDDAQRELAKGAP